MAKKSSTIHIENCFWDLIEDYQKSNDMNSRNTAIECILSEYKALKNLSSNSLITKEKNDKQYNELAIDKRDPMDDKLSQMEDDMPD